MYRHGKVEQFSPLQTMRLIKLFSIKLGHIYFFFSLSMEIYTWMNMTMPSGIILMIYGKSLAEETLTYQGGGGTYCEVEN